METKEKAGLRISFGWESWETLSRSDHGQTGSEAARGMRVALYKISGASRRASASGPTCVCLYNMCICMPQHSRTRLLIFPGKLSSRTLIRFPAKQRWEEPQWRYFLLVNRPHPFPTSLHPLNLSIHLSAPLCLCVRVSLATCAIWTSGRQRRRNSLAT